MSDQKVTVLAVFRAKPGGAKKLYAVLSAMADEARNDPGCLLFECKRSRDHADLFLFHEEWNSQDDVENHLKMPYLTKYREQRAPYLEGDPEVSAWLS